MRRTAGIALAALGLIVALVGIIIGVVDKTESTATAVAEGGSAPYVYSAPGVLELGAKTVKVKVTGSSNADVTLAFGASDDVESWVKGLHATKITGLTDWTKLKTVTVKAGSKASEKKGAPSLADSDMGIEKKTQKGSVEQQYRIENSGSISLIATSSDGKAPTVSLTWDRNIKPFNNFPIIVLGLGMAIAGAVLLALDHRDKLQKAEREAIRERKLARRAARAEAETTVLAASGPSSSDSRQHRGSHGGSQGIPPGTQGTPPGNGAGWNAEHGAYGPRDGGAPANPGPQSESMPGNVRFPAANPTVPGIAVGGPVNRPDGGDGPDASDGISWPGAAQPIGATQPIGAPEPVGAAQPIDGTLPIGATQPIGALPRQMVPPQDIPPRTNVPMIGSDTQEIDPVSMMVHEARIESDEGLHSEIRSDSDERHRSARHEQASDTGMTLGAGIIAGSPRAHELRGRELSEKDRIVIPEASGQEFTAFNHGAASGLEAPAHGADSGHDTASMHTALVPEGPLDLNAAIAGMGGGDVSAAGAVGDAEMHRSGADGAEDFPTTAWRGRWRFTQLDDAGNEENAHA